VVPEERTEQRPWERTASRTRPKDGEKAEVLNGHHPTVMVFRAAPIARWESLDGRHVYDFTFFEKWRLL
jgi:hypothetical protein